MMGMLRVLAACLILPVVLCAYSCPSGCSCSSSASVSCSRVSSWPGDLPLDTKSLTFSYPKLSEIPPGAFRKYPRLESISFSYGSIGKISQHAFRFLPFTKTVSFSRTDIGTIESGAFIDLTEYIRRRITFSYAKITIIKPYAFFNLVGIDTLSFSYSTIQTVEPYAVTRIKHSKSFDISRSKITTLKSYSLDFPPHAFFSASLSYTSVVNIGCHTLEDLDSVSRLTANCNCDIMRLFERNTAFSGSSQITCIDESKLEGTIPSIINQCTRPVIRAPVSAVTVGPLTTAVTPVTSVPVIENGHPKCSLYQIPRQLKTLSFQEILSCLKISFDAAAKKLSFKLDMSLD